MKQRLYESALDYDYTDFWTCKLTVIKYIDQQLSYAIVDANLSVWLTANS